MLILGILEQEHQVAHCKLEEKRASQPCRVFFESTIYLAFIQGIHSINIPSVNYAIDGGYL